MPAAVLTPTSPWVVFSSRFFSSIIADVANAVAVPTTSASARTIPIVVVLFVFIIATILSSIAIFPNPLQNGFSLLFFSSMPIRARAYADFVASPNVRTTASSQASSISRFARTYITQTRGLNQWTQSAAASSHFASASNRRTCVYSWARTYPSCSSSAYSVVFGSSTTGLTNP